MERFRRYGTYTFTVQVTDANSQVATKPFTMVPLKITTSSLFNGAVDMSYSQTLAATGGKTPYSWSVGSGSLPPGLGLSTEGALEWDSLRRQARTLSQFK